MSTSAHSISRLPLAEVVDVLLADIALKIQLSPTDYDRAIQHYETLSAWIDRPGSPLENLVESVYAQGSIAIGSTISSRLSTDEFDVDAVAQLALPRSIQPAVPLDLLYQSIKGQPGSRYYDKVRRQTRCVTVEYDRMHVDLTPAIVIEKRPELTSHIFHSKPEEPRHMDDTLVANPYGFAEWFKLNTPADYDFFGVLSERGRILRGQERITKADSEPLPDQVPLNQKSKAVIVLQLIKRWRNVQYDERNGSGPPSVLLAKLIADNSNATDTLSEELSYQACAVLTEFRRWHNAGRLIHVENPACAVDDVFTDRWPRSFESQAEFIGDLEELNASLQTLTGDCSLQEMRSILSLMFGEAPTTDVIRDFNERAGANIRDGLSHHRPGGRLGLAASGIIAGSSVSRSARPAPKHTFFGD